MRGNFTREKCLVLFQQVWVYHLFNFVIIAAVIVIGICGNGSSSIIISNVIVSPGSYMLFIFSLFFLILLLLLLLLVLAVFRSIVHNFTVVTFLFFWSSSLKLFTWEIYAWNLYFFPTGLGIPFYHFYYCCNCNRNLW